MGMVFFNDKKVLSDDVINMWTMTTEETYRKVAANRAADSTQLRLAIEELLLRFRELYGTATPCHLKGFKRFGRISFELSQHGHHQSPLDIAPGMSLPYDLLARLNLKPIYTYREARNLNIVSIPAPLKPRKNAMLISILLAVFLAFITWIVSALLPPLVLNGYMMPLITALFRKMTTLFSALATPLVFFAVIAGISDIGGVSSFGKLGGRLLGRMMITYGVAMLAMLAVGLPMGIVSTASVQAAGNPTAVFLDLVKLVLDIIPSNLVEPFRIDNDLQVIVLAIFVGLIMLALGDKVRHIKTFVNEAGTLINRMMVTICKILPLFVYLGLTGLLLSGHLAELKSLTKIVIISLVGAAITISSVLIRARLVTKKPLKWIVSAQIPSLLINLTTSSQVSALPESMKCCKEKWGVDERFTDFSLPLGIVIYMPNGAIMLGAIVWVLSSVAGSPVDPATLIKLVFVSVIVAIAAPPIPGSIFAVLPILFSSCGTDLSVMPLAVVIGSTIAYLLPAFNGFCLQLEILMSAWKEGCVKKNLD